jgi:hypothetical protein
MSQDVRQRLWVSSHRTGERSAPYNGHYLGETGGWLLPDAYDPDVTPEVGELDELETFVGSKKQDLAVDGR